MEIGVDPALAPKLEMFQQDVDKYIYIYMSMRLKPSMWPSTDGLALDVSELPAV